MEHILAHRPRKNVCKVLYSQPIMLIICQLFSIHLILLIKSILTVPLSTDSSKLSPRDTFGSSPLINEDDSGSSDLFYSSSTQNACLSSQTELFISSNELGVCSGGGTKLPDEATPLPPVNLGFPDLFDVFGIGGEDEQSPDAVNRMIWEGEDVNPCRGRNPYRLHVCCEGELGIFEGSRLNSIEDCVIRTYLRVAISTRLRSTGFLLRVFLLGFCYSFSHAPLFLDT